MKLSEFANNPDRLSRELKTARASFLKDARVNDGIRSSQDVQAILNNRATETVDWSPLYQYAEQFD